MKKFIVFILVILPGFLFINAQEKVYMPFFEVINMHPDYSYSTSKLFKTYSDNVNRYQLVLPLKSDSLNGDNSLEKVKEEAEVLGCPYFLTGEFNRLGDVVIITLNMYHTSDGSKMWNSLSKALTPDDIDPIMEKMSRDLGLNTSPSEGDIYDVTNYDSRELNKIGANKFFGATIGGGYTFVSGISDNFPAGFGIMGSYDMRNWIFNLKAETYFSDANIYYLNIDAMHPFSTGKNSAFISGAMGYGGVSLMKNSYTYSYERKNGGGLMLFAGGGYLINRNSNVSLRFSGNLYAPFFKVDGDIPLGILFSTSLLFGR